MDIENLLSQLKAYRRDIDRAVEALEAISKRQSSREKVAERRHRNNRGKVRGATAVDRPPLEHSAKIIPFVPALRSSDDDLQVKQRRKDAEECDDRLGSDIG